MRFFTKNGGQSQYLVKKEKKIMPGYCFIYLIVDLYGLLQNRPKTLFFSLSCRVAM